MIKKLFPILIIVMASIPTFYRMLPPGIFTMHDFHVFRQFEFQKCVSDGVFPCRWAPDSGLGYGEPIFNFYGQIPYWLGAVPGFLGFQVIDSIKFSFAFSLIASGLAMFLLAKNFWRTPGAVLSAIFYMYAPYRAVDVWVRGALPEALGFVLIPLILHFLYRFLRTKSLRPLVGFTFSLAGLICTHNLSAFIFAPFLLCWWFFFSFKFKSFSYSLPLFISSIFVIGLSAFYLNPVIFESSLTTISKTTQNYYDYRIHYATLHQLFISSFWGYGGTTWGPNDTMSFSVGYWHWLVPILLTAYLGFRKIFFKKTLNREFILFLLLGFISLFLTHGKSDPLWSVFPGASFIQFPWRFLIMAAVFLSLSAGFLANLFLSKKEIIIASLITVGVIVTNVSYFRPDIWHTLSDRQYFSGKLWDEQRSSALQDYWPISSPEFPKSFAPDDVIFNEGTGQTLAFQKLSSAAVYKISVSSPSAQISFPIVYFPGWQAKLNNEDIAVIPTGRLGLLTANVPQGEHLVNLEFKDTPPRIWGNLISLIFLAISAGLSGFIFTRYAKK